MFEYTRDNHYRFGYSGNWFTYDTDEIPENSQWQVIYGKCSEEWGIEAVERSKEMSWKEECIRAAKMIKESTDLPINLFLSGGLDSEIMLYSFLDAGIPIEASILHFKNNYNIHDTAFAVAICESLNVKYNLVDLDAQKFWESGELFEYVDRVKSASVVVCFHMWLADQVDGLPVLGGGDFVTRLYKDVPGGFWEERDKAHLGGYLEEFLKNHSFYLNPHNLKTEWRIRDSEAFSTIFRHFIFQERPAVPTFFRYTPEMIYTFLIDPAVRNLVSQEHGILRARSVKYDLYKRHYNILPRRERSGFEKLPIPKEVRNYGLRNYPRYFAYADYPYYQFLNELHPTVWKGHTLLYT